MNTSVIFPPKAAPALGLLKSSKNDIEIFVENSVGNNIWVNLLRAYLPSGIKLESVNLLGSRDDVLNACKNDQREDGRKKLYIIDADFDLLGGVEKRSLKHLYRLRGYCLENYLIDFEAIVLAVTLVNAETPLDQVRSRLKLEDWMARNREALSMLFVCYAVVREITPRKKTVSYSARNLIVDGVQNFDFCNHLVKTRIIELYRLVLKNCGKKRAREVFERNRDNAQKWKVEAFVSGKDYILPIVYDYVKYEFKVKLRPLEFHTLIAGCINKVEDKFLERRLHKICSV